MTKNHIKTIAAPKRWPVNRKKEIFILKPDSGPHNLKNSVSLNFVIIEMLKLAKIKRESKYILQNKEILVDGKRRKNISFPVGLFDVLSIKDIKKNYRMTMDNKGRLKVIEIDDKEALLKPLKITGKNLIGGKTQINFFDGTNMIVEKDEYKVGGTLLIDVIKREVKQHMRLEKGKMIFIIDGKKIGSTGIIEDIMGDKIIYKADSNAVFETLKDYAFVIGENKPVIKIN